MTTTTKDILRRIGGGTARRHAKPAATPRVAIVGGGFAGIAAGVKLRKAGIDNFTIFERSLGIGGTWRDNTYPGCEVDTHSHLYSFSFTHPDWSRTHARQPELQKYLEGVVDEYDLRRHFRMGISVDEAVWDELESPEVDETLARLDEALTVRDALASLPADCREVLDRFFARDESYKTIGEALDLPSGTIASRISRCLARLRELLEGRSDADPPSGGR